MKTRIIFPALLIVCFACGTNNKPVSDSQKEKIQGEIKELQNTVVQALEEIDWVTATESVLDSPEFLYVNNGKADNYEEFMARKSRFGTLLNQKCTIVGEIYNIPDSYTVLYTMKCSWLANYKDGHSVLADPSVTQVLYKKINNKWRAININESGVEQRVKNTETSEELNQVELIKQSPIIGSWKFEYGKDTTGYMDCTTYGTGIDVNAKYVTKGNNVKEARIIWAYDKTFDKMIGLSQIKGGDVVELRVSQWISKNNYVLAPYNDISNPKEASTRTEGTFTSHDLLEITHYVDNKPVNTVIYTRVE